MHTNAYLSYNFTLKLFSKSLEIKYIISIITASWAMAKIQLEWYLKWNGQILLVAQILQDVGFTTAVLSRLVTRNVGATFVNDSVLETYHLKCKS